MAKKITNKELLAQIRDVNQVITTVSELQMKHEELDLNRFNQIPTKEDIVKVVGEAVDTKINGKLIKIQGHLENQDTDVGWIKRGMIALFALIGSVLIGVLINFFSK